MALFSGQTEQALVYLAQSYAAYEQLADPVGMAQLKIKQAQISWFHNLEGLALFEEGLTDLRQMGARREAAAATAVLALLLADVEIQAAAVKAAAAEELCRTLGDRRGAAIAQGVLSRAALVDGRYAEAAQLAADYLQAARALALPVELTEALCCAAWAALGQDQVSQAEEYVIEALQIPTYWRVVCLGVTAVLLARRSADNYDRAWQLLGHGESCCGRLRGPVAQELLRHFLPPAMQAMPPLTIATLKEAGVLSMPVVEVQLLPQPHGATTNSSLSGMARLRESPTGKDFLQRSIR